MNTNTTSTNTYPDTYSRNSISKGNRGTNNYLMQTTTYQTVPLSSKSTGAEVDINGSFAWSNNLTAGTYDVQDVMTHEFGHICGLADLYGTSDSEKTMYGYSSPVENKKYNLEPDDIAGINALY
jgi:hypothetical protein